LRNHHTTHVVETPAGAFLYALGGVNGTEMLTNVDRATLGADGSIGEWTASTALPEGVAGHTTGVVGRTFVVAGGMSMGAATTFSAKTYTAHLEDDGSLGAWTPGPPLSHARMHGASFVDGDSVYVLGGFQDETLWDDVLRARVEEGGTLGEWEQVGTLPGKLSHFAVTRVGRFIYITGGIDQSPFSNSPSLRDVKRGHIGDDGSVSEWADVPKLPRGLSIHAGFAYGGYLYAVGGLDESLVFTDHVYRAPLRDGGASLGEWETVAPLPRARGHVHQTPVYRDHVYSISGAIDFNHHSTNEVAIGVFGTTN
jgi:N-acetylneuraminic acid mutarotase